MPLGGVDDLAPFALAIVSLVIIVGVGSMVLTEFQPAAFDDVLVEDDRYQPSDTLPTSFLLDVVQEGVVENSEQLWLDELGDNTDLIELEEGTDYEVLSYENGEIELKDSATLSAYNSADNDEIVVDYEYQESTEASGILDTAVQAMQTFSDFFTVIVVIGIAAVIFMLLSVLRASGRAGV